MPDRDDFRKSLPGNDFEPPRPIPGRSAPATDHGTMQGSGWLAAPRAALPALILATLMAMGPSLFNGFVYDDVAAILTNERVHSVDLGSLFSSPYWTNTLYRPVTTTAFALLWQAGGGSPLPFHLANLIFAIVATLLVWRLALALKASPQAALIAALLFAVHPVHVEAVANGVGLAEVLSGSLALATCLAFTRRRPSALMPAVAALSALAAFLAKESAITVLALAPLLALVRWREVDAADRSSYGRAAALMLVAVLAGLTARTAVLGSLGGEAPARYLETLSTSERWLTVLTLVPEWTRLLFWPAHLQADYGPPRILAGAPPGWPHLAGAAIIAVWAAATVLAWRSRDRLLTTGLLWIPIALSPVSNLLFPTGIALAERTLFLTSVGAVLVVAGIVDRLSGPVRKGAFAAAAVLVALGAIRSHDRTRTWRDQRGFFDQLTADAPDSYRAWYVAGGYHNHVGNADSALVLLGRAWDLEKRDFRVAEELGQALRAAGRFEEALPIFRAGNDRNPTHEPLLSRLMETLIALDRWDDVDRLIAEAGSRDPEDGRRLRKRADAAREARRDRR